MFGNTNTREGIFLPLFVFTTLYLVIFRRKELGVVSIEVLFSRVDALRFSMALFVTLWRLHFWRKGVRNNSLTFFNPHFNISTFQE